MDEWAAKVQETIADFEAAHPDFAVEFPVAILENLFIGDLPSAETVVKDSASNITSILSLTERELHQALFDDPDKEFSDLIIQKSQLETHQRVAQQLGSIQDSLEDENLRNMQFVLSEAIEEGGEDGCDDDDIPFGFDPEEDNLMEIVGDDNLKNTALTSSTTSRTTTVSKSKTMRANRVTQSGLQALPGNISAPGVLGSCPKHKFRATTLDSLPSTDVTRLLGDEIRSLFPKYVGYCAADLPNYDMLQHFESCFSFIEEGMGRGDIVLVHCLAGQNRSGFVVLGYLLRKFRWGLLEALKFCLERRGGILKNKGFQRQICEFAFHEKLEL